MDSLPELVRLFGKKLGGQLGKLGLETTADLLHHYPRRYVQRGELTPLDHGEEGDYITYIARLKEKEQRRVKNNTLTLTKLVFTDGATDITCAFFSKSSFRVNKVVRELQIGDTAMITGRIKYRWLRRGGFERELIHPQVMELPDPIDPKVDPEGAAAQAAQPLTVYPIIQGLHTDAVANAVKTVLGPMQPEEIPDPVPEHVRKENGLMPLFDAFWQIHFPRTMRAAEQAAETLRFHEAFVLQSALAQRRMWADSFEAAPRPYQEAGLRDALDARLPYSLTAGQRDVGAEIEADLTKDRGMQRLLQGDVGSGKTVVALRAMLQVIDAGGQAALLAPTEVLATQHLRSIQNLLGELSGEVGLTLLTGSLPAAARRQALLDAASGKAGIVVGTHALLSDDVQFAELGLVVVDEQHRFGVDQRDALRGRAKKVPHYLVMTATPIPRSVALTLFGDIDTSILSEMPAGRAEVVTHLVPESNPEWMQRVWERIAEEARAGGRVYVVCPRIEADDDGEGDLEDAAQEGEEVTSVHGLAKRIEQDGLLEGVEFGIMHGRLSTEEKDEAMARFMDGSAPVLISTTVIEVGVDVPDATAMVIMDGHMFGISQLHQLRGRIGRGTRPGVCLVVTSTTSEYSIERLKAFAGTRDGFELAEMDLKLRREGDVLGRAQSGRATSLRLLRVMEDGEIIERARNAAWAILQEDPDLVRHPALAAAVERVAEQEEFLNRA